MKRTGVSEMPSQTPFRSSWTKWLGESSVRKANLFDVPLPKRQDARTFLVNIVSHMAMEGMCPPQPN